MWYSPDGYLWRDVSDQTPCEDITKLTQPKYIWQSGDPTTGFNFNLQGLNSEQLDRLCVIIGYDNLTKSVKAIGGCFGNGTSVAHYKIPAHTGGIVTPPSNNRVPIELRTLQDPHLYQPPYSLSKDTLAQVTL